MKIVTREIEFDTQGHTEIKDLTPEIISCLKKTGLSEGMAFVFAVGSTAGLTTCEYEPALVKDLRDFFDRLIPESVGYAHDATWGDANGHSHIRASLVKPSLSIPFKDRRLMLGTWQQVIYIDFDHRARHRTVVVQFHGHDSD